MNYLEIIGLCTLVYILLIKLTIHKTLYNTVVYCIDHYYSKSIESSIILKKLSNNIIQSKNQYAVITGGTDGIGLEYARQLAKRGYCLLLLSRNEKKLQKIAQEIEHANKKLGIKVRSLSSLSTLSKYKSMQY